MVTKLKKINPITYRIGFCFFWNKSINNNIKKYNKFLKFVYFFSYFFTVLFEKFFKFQLYKLNLFFKPNQILFNFNIYSLNLIYFSVFNLYLPKLYLNRLNVNNFKSLKKKIILKKFILLSKLNNDLFKHLNELPSTVIMPGGQTLAVEWADAIHIATALSRDLCNVATTDGRLIQIPQIKKKLAL